MRTSSLLLAASLPLMGATLAFAQPSSQPTTKPAAQPKLKVTIKAPETLTLGEDLEIAIRVENVGEGATPMRQIALSSHSAFIELSGRRWKQPFAILRFPGGIPNLTPGAQTALAPGKVIEGKLTVPTVETGAFELRVGVTGHVPFPLPRGLRVQPFYSQKVKVDVRPTKAGAVRYQVLMKTNHGDVRLSLDDEAAPCSVRNFVTLIRKDFYSGLKFHRVIKGFMIQGGDPKGDGTGGPGYTIPAEFSRTRQHKPGALAMARTQHPHTAGSQFYVCLGSPRHLDGQYTIFGQVVEGQSVIDAIGALPVGAADKPTKDAVMTSLTLIAVDAEGKPCEPSQAEGEPKQAEGEPKQAEGEPKGE
jgi:cyclophilin family peptidyl-prolyl cis-trans isomerase